MSFEKAFRAAVVALLAVFVAKVSAQHFNAPTLLGLFTDVAFYATLSASMLLARLRSVSLSLREAYGFDGCSKWDRLAIIGCVAMFFFTIMHMSKVLAEISGLPTEGCVLCRAFLMMGWSYVNLIVAIILFTYHSLFRELARWWINRQ